MADDAARPASPPELKVRSPRATLAILAVTALGVVYGDIGTSPLYALRECFNPEHGVAATSENVLGVLSLIFWALVLVISTYYLMVVMRADNRGEGGILALMAIVHPEHGAKGRRTRKARLALILLGLFGAALLYGDGMITPAISVLSAVEGLDLALNVPEQAVLGITIAILIGLFFMQRRGTAGVGIVFGPITILWFAVLAVLGVRGILLAPEVLQAMNPVHGISFFLRNGLTGFLVLGTVFLVVTGGEALYADMGHFGRKPIRIAWFALVLPALLLNYFGQGALLLASPETASNPFYLLAPEWALLPLVVIATGATIIASQAVISGAFSLTMQAVHLGYSPRLRIEHTSPTERGQIYIPAINWTLMLATVALVLSFRSSSNLAAAYGVAVTTTMVITTVLLMTVARELWGWNPFLAFGLLGCFLLIDVSFFSANLYKVPEGGWFPIVVAALAFTLMSTWRRGRKVLAERLQATTVPLDRFLEGIRGRPPARVPGTAVFLTGNSGAAPPALQRNLSHNKVLHEKVLILTVAAEEVAYLPAAERLEFEGLGDGFYRAVAHYGFMEDPNVPEIMVMIREHGLEFDPEDVTYFLGRERPIAARGPGGMALWREKVFEVMVRNAQQATAFFRIPPERVVEVGAQIKL